MKTGDWEVNLLEPFTQVQKDEMISRIQAATSFTVVISKALDQFILCGLGDAESLQQAKIIAYALNEVP